MFTTITDPKNGTFNKAVRGRGISALMRADAEENVKGDGPLRNRKVSSIMMTWLSGPK